MRRLFVSVLALVLCAPALCAGETSKLVKTRLASSAAAASGVWLSNLSKAKSYATKNKVPLVAVWSNGDRCSHCIRFESACNSDAFRKWMKTSRMVFYFITADDKAGKKGGSAFEWIRGSNTSYPFVRVYWPAGGVDVRAVGDTLDGYANKETGGKNVIAWLKARCAGFYNGSPGKKTVVTRKYKVKFDPNGGTGSMAAKTAKVGTAFTLPANAFTCKDYAFSGWAKSPTGSVAYKNKASVKNLSKTDGAVVTLYAKWTKTVYRGYYAGVKATVQMTSGLKGATTSSKVPGLKWNSSKYCWTGTPTKAGTFTVKLSKSGKTHTRKIVVSKDAVVWPEGTLGLILPIGEGIDLPIVPSSHAGAARSVAVTGLPEGLSYSGGAITGSTAMRGTFRLSFAVVSAQGQKLTGAYDLNIGVPECCTGTFIGFTGFLDTNRLDVLRFADRGTFRLSAPSNAALSAKVVTAKGTYSFTGTGWLDLGDGTYRARLASSDGVHALEVLAGEEVPPYDCIREIGVFTPSYGTAYEVWAQRAPFARDEEGNYRNPIVADAMADVAGTWYFKAYAVGSEWVLGYGTSKAYDLKLTVAADGTAKLAGKVGSHTVSAASAVFVFPGDVETGFVRADFPVAVTVSKKKKTLDIWTSLWFDRSNDHLTARGEGIGGAAVEDFN